jgi:hypothetical protein
MKTCRCGFIGEDTDHPCHGHNYTCSKPGIPRFAVTGPANVAGNQMKMSAYQTFSCDECWEAYQKRRKEAGY